MYISLTCVLYFFFKDEPPIQLENKEAERITPSENKSLGFGLFGGVSNFTRLVETTGTSLFATGLDTLESIGKKTIDVLQQTDPGFKKTRATLVNPLAGTSQEKVCLSQVNANTFAPPFGILQIVLFFCLDFERGKGQQRIQNM